MENATKAMKLMELLYMATKMTFSQARHRRQPAARNHVHCRQSQAYERRRWRYSRRIIDITISRLVEYLKQAAAVDVRSAAEKLLDTCKRAELGKSSATTALWTQQQIQNQTPIQQAQFRSQGLYQRKA